MNREYENKIILSGGVHNLAKYNDSAQIIIKGDTIINAINLHNNMNLYIVLEPGASLLLNMFDYAVNLESNIKIEAGDRSSFVINCSFISETKYELNIDTLFYGDDITGSVNIRGINEEEGTTKVSMSGTVAGETHGNVLNEYAKVLNKSIYSNVLIPNLIINTSEVEANHGVTIGHIREDELFYLMSKGISRSTAIKTIEEGFILSIMDEEIKQKILNILIGR